MVNIIADITMIMTMTMQEKQDTLNTLNISLLNYSVTEGHKHSSTQEMNPRPCSQWYALEFSCWNDSPAQIDTRVHISNILLEKTKLNRGFPTNMIFAMAYPT